MNSSLLDSIYVLVTLAIFIAVAYGMAFWARRAAGDRSALVGLYLILGIPGGLLTLLGLARLAGGQSSGFVWLAAGLGLILPMSPQFRARVARHTPMDPKSSIDMVGLSIVLAFIGFFLFQYALSPEPEETGEISIAYLVSQFVFMIVLAFVLVGVRQWRNWRQAAERLGLGRLTPREVGISLLAVVGGLLVMGIAGALTAWLQPDFNNEIQQTTDDITSNVSSLAGAVFFGLGAGASEETLLRGAIQPRYGIWITSLLFALLHSQYGISFVLGGVFFMGVILGLLRNRINTTAAILTHAVFNTIVVLLGS
ncbi:MAG: CPBP family intramembrane metalloprotease [Thermomicrobiales bacterium]|nr:CPBP family intramembrane metalloprotease [Thermomicrobiales bacterium]MCO5223462.1 CPBP family intramembrane metalloprotease [Thermomicrobiales bacterium]